MKSSLTKLWALSAAAALPSFVFPVQWVGNTKMFLNGMQLPQRAAYVEAFQSVTITTETWPIQPNQRVFAVVTTDNFATTQEYEFTFDGNVGNNSRWYRILGSMPKGTQVDYYIRAESPTETAKFDNNGWQNFGYFARFAPNYRSGAILQWFETSYSTILQRLPEVIKAGYSAIYLPSPVKSGGGGFSVGYNPFDRFDLGDRLQAGTVKTKYGSTQELVNLIRTAKRLGLEVYCDIVLNHNDNRASTAINRYPDMIPEDFHIRSSSDTGNSEINFNTESAFSNGMLNHDLVGLADIAHEDNNNTRTGAFTLPPFASMNGYGKPSFIRHPQVASYYPGGTPVAEDVRQYLGRWMRFMVETVGFDGFRLDAVKHMPPAFLGYAPAQPPGGGYGNGDLLPSLYRNFPNLYIFGEDYTSGPYELREYAKTGMNLLDFPLRFNLANIFNSQGFGDLSAALSNYPGLDGATGLVYQNGGLGLDSAVGFVQSHDDGPPQSNNLAYAFLLNRPGRAKVYYDGNNIQPGNWSNFPRPGREDSLGEGALKPLLDIAKRYSRGVIVNRRTTANLYVYERQVFGKPTVIVGLNSRGDMTEQTATIPTAFPAGTVLRDLTGQKPDVIVSANNEVTLTIPANSTATNSNNATGYGVYGPIAPAQLANVRPVSLVVADRRRTDRNLVPQTFSMPGGIYAAGSSFGAFRVAADTIDLNVTTDTRGVRAYAMLDAGIGFGGQTPLTATSEGLTDGYVQLNSLGSGKFSLPAIDLRGLADGLHVFRVRVFSNNPSDPGVFNEFPTFFYLERGLGGSVTVDGDLAEYGSPITTQVRVPSSNQNRLDALYAINDSNYLYFGLAGQIDASDSLTNGIWLWLDTDATEATGVRNFASVNDDSGPATRLLSNTALTAPAGFGGDFGIGVYKGTSLSSAQFSPKTGSPINPSPVGAWAGTYKLGSDLNRLQGVASTIAYQPRANKTDPAKGYEIAIPLSTLYPNGISPAQQLRFLGGLGTTGESGSTLLSNDPNRATLGGRPAAISWMSNQFLPTQGNIFSNLGTAAFTLPSYGTYNLNISQSVQNVSFAVVSTLASRNGLSQRVRITNTSGQAITGPFTLLVQTSPTVPVLNKSGMSRLVTNAAAIAVTGSTIPAGGFTEVAVNYPADAGSFTTQFSLRSGNGIY